VQLQLTYLVDGVEQLTVMFDGDLNPMIGRDPAGNDVVLHHGTVSRIHARIINRDGVLSVQDLGSRSGTLVNGESITTPRTITPKDLVTVGKAVLKAELVDFSFAREDDGQTMGLNTHACLNPGCNARVPSGFGVCLKCGTRQ
jgi:predicted component of type VI protein secretion system